MESGKNKQAKIRKAVAFHAKSGGLSIPPMKVGQKMKQSMDTGQTNKKVQGLIIRLDRMEAIQGTLKLPCHGVGKGLMNSKGLVIYPPINLLVKSSEYDVDTFHSLV